MQAQQKLNVDLYANRTHHVIFYAFQYLKPEAFHDMLMIKPIVEKAGYQGL